MKKYLLYELLQLIRTRPDLKRKLKIFLLVGFVGFVLVGGLAVWGTIKAVQIVADKAGAVIENPQIQAQVQEQAQNFNVTQFNALNCWDSAIRLVGVRPWLERPVYQNLDNLKQACFPQEGEKKCEGEACEGDPSWI